MLKRLMPIIPRAPASVLDCSIFLALHRKSTALDGLYDKAVRFVEIAAPLNDLVVAGPFKNYTLHNAGHSKKVLHLMGQLLSADGVDRLSALDCLILIYASHLHDMGMALTSHEREKILVSDAYIDQRQNSPALAQALASAEARLQAAMDEGATAVAVSKVYELNEALLSEYLRPRHALPVTYEELLERINQASDRKDLFDVAGASFKSALVNVCASHGLDAGVLLEVDDEYAERYPRQDVYSGQYLNQQFCSALLRIADILDFDRERTPRVLFESLGIADRSLPGAEVSVSEWQKHLAVHTIEIRSQEFVVNAQAKHPVIEKAIREFCSFIEREIRDTLSVLRRNTEEIQKQYPLELPISVRPQIRSVGYVYREMALSLNQSRILSLLMGSNLYSSPVVALRELLQNAIDACLVRKSQEERYSPTVRLTDELDSQGNYWLVVTDDGMGMDEHILSEYFLKLGNSYYGSTEFRRNFIIHKESKDKFNPISRFGIGLASVFLMADVIEVNTKCFRSPRGDMQGRRVRVEGLLSLAFVSLDENASVGTQIKLCIKSSYVENKNAFTQACISFLRNSLVRPKVPIEVDLAGNKVTFDANRSVVLKSAASALMRERSLELVLIDVARWSDRIRGTLGLFFFVSDDGKFSITNGGKRIKFGDGGIDPTDYVQDYRGNRLSVNGFSMSMKGINRILKVGKSAIPMIYDLDVRGDAEVEYDISRQRIVGSGSLSVKKEIKQVLARGLEELGIATRLDGQARAIIATPVTSAGNCGVLDLYGMPRREEDPAIVDLVAQQLDDDPLDRESHKRVAAALQISNGRAFRCISALIAQGRITLPEPKTQETGTQHQKSIMDSYQRELVRFKESCLIR